MALDGTLRDMSLSDLFQVFRMGPKTGILLLTSDEQRGIIYVAAGQLIDAAIMAYEDRAIISSHDEAVIQMLLWDDARFTFRPTQSVMDRPLRMGHDSEWLVMESLRRRDDPTKVFAYHTITLDTQLQLSPLPSSAESGVSLDVNQWRILSQVSIAPDLRTICQETGIDPNQAIRTVAELLSVGLVEIVPPKLQAPKVHVHEDTLLQHSKAMLGTGVSAEQGGHAAGRVLLDAIMRRVRGL